MLPARVSDIAAPDGALSGLRRLKQGGKGSRKARTGGRGWKLRSSLAHPPPPLGILEFQGFLDFIDFVEFLNFIYRSTNKFREVLGKSKEVLGRSEGVLGIPKNSLEFLKVLKQY